MESNTRNKYSIYAIESRDLQSTKVMRETGIDEPITAFSRNRHDVTKMETSGLGVTKQHADAREMYASAEFRAREHVVVWHDGQQIGRNTLADVKQILDNEHKSIGLAVNMVMRCRAMSHQHFGQDIARYGASRGYRVKYVKLASYKQKAKGGSYMQPYWIELVRKKRA